MSRTFESGGETLAVGSTVIIFDGNSQKERAITQVGTKRVHIESERGQQATPYSLETRTNLQGQYTSYFRTKTEVAEYARRDIIRNRLQGLGVDFTVQFLNGGRKYSAEALERVIGILEADTPK